MRPPQTYRDFLNAGVLFLSAPTLTFVSIVVLSLQHGAWPFAVAAVGIWALIMLVAIVAVIYRVETVRRLTGPGLNVVKRMSAVLDMSHADTSTSSTVLVVTDMNT
jgi:hypothetical protein